MMIVLLLASGKSFFILEDEVTRHFPKRETRIKRIKRACGKKYLT